MGALILYSVPGTAATVACAALEETGAPYETVQVERHDRLSDNSLRAAREWEALEDGWATALEPLDPSILRGRPE